MKYARILACILLFSLILTGCAAGQQPYTYQGGGKTIEVYPADGKMVCGLMVFYYTVSGNDRSTHYNITYPDGSEYSWSQSGGSGSGGGSNGYADHRYVPGMTLVDAIRAGREQNRPFPWYALVLAGLGFLLFRFPEESWTVTYGWKFKNAEPSAAYLGYTRFCGGAAMAVGALLLGAFVLEGLM